MAWQLPNAPIPAFAGPRQVDASGLLSDLGTAIGKGIGDYRDRQAQEEGISNLLGIMGRNEGLSQPSGGGLSSLGALFNPPSVYGYAGTGASQPMAPAIQPADKGPRPNNADARVSSAFGDDIFGRFIGTVQEGGLTNPYGLAAVAATGKHESGYTQKNAFGEWADPSESGQAGQAGGVMSWRAERLAKMRNFAAMQGDDPRRPSPETQAKFLLAEDPTLISKLNNAGSVQEAQTLMNRAWRFAGYDRPGGEAANRLNTAGQYLSAFSGQGEFPAMSAGDNRYTMEDVNGGGSPAMAASAPAQRTPPSQFLDTAMQLVRGAAGESGAPKPTAEEFRALMGSEVTRPFAMALWKANVTKEPADLGTALDIAKFLADGQGGAPDYGFQNVGGTLVRTDSTSGTVAPVFTAQSQPEPGFTMIEEGEAFRLGLPEGQAYQRGPDGRVYPLKGPGSGGGVTIAPDGTIQIGGKIPAGFQPDPETPGALMPIPGGPGEQISGELAARLGLADNFLERAPALRQKLLDGDASGPWDVFQARNNQSSAQAEVHRELEYGVEALVRMLTGAGMNMAEAEERARRYLPTYTDKAASMVSKLDGLTDYLRSTKEMAMRGRGGRAGERSQDRTADPIGAPSGDDPEIDDLVRRYGG